MTTKWYLYATDKQYKAIAPVLRDAELTYERLPSWMSLPAVQAPALIAKTHEGLSLLVEGMPLIKNFLFKKSETGKSYSALTDIIVQDALDHVPRPVSEKQRDYLTNVAKAITADVRSTNRRAKHA